MVRATPTILQIGLAFLFFAKTLKISYPTVWQLGLAFIASWQILLLSWHLCTPRIGLAFYMRVLL